MTAGPAARAAGLLERGELAGGDHPAGDPDELLELAGAIAGVNALVLLIDDAEWLDSPSLEFLAELAPRSAGLPLGLLVARGDGPEEGLEWLRSPGVRRIEAGPLAPAAVAAIVREALPDATDAFCRDCLRITHGNAGLLRELLVELAGVAPSSGADELPAEAVARLVLSRLAGLRSDAQELARGLAVLGADPAPTVLAELAEVPEADLATQVELLRSAAMLDASGRIEFSHPLVEAAVREGTPRSHRSRLHRRAAALLAAQGEGEGAGKVAAHLALTLPSADPEVAAALRSAAAEALAGGEPEASRRLLLRALDEPPDAAARAATLRELAAAEVACGSDEAPERIDAALRSTASAPERVELLLLSAQARRDRGEWEAAAETLAGALAELEDTEEAGLRARVEGERVLASLLAGRGDVATGQDTEAERAASEPLLLARALALTVAGSDREAALELTERAGPSSPAWLRAEIMLRAGSLARALELSDEALAEADRRGFAADRATARYLRSRALLARGMVPEAIADATAALEAEPNGWGHSVPAARAVLSLALLARGEADEAAAHLDELDPATWSQAPSWPALLGARGAIEASRGRSEDALDAFRSQGELTTSGTPPIGAAWRVGAALALSRLGRDDEAESMAREELAAARRWGERSRIGAALRAVGVAQGGEAGLETLREATSILAGSGAVLEGWQARLELGAALRRAGRRGEAREPLHAVAAEAAEAGAEGLAERAREELALTGERARGGQLTGVALAHARGGESREARGRRDDQPADRRVPSGLPEGGPVAPAQHLPQAGDRRTGRAAHGTRRLRLASWRRSWQGPTGHSRARGRPCSSGTVRSPGSGKQSRQRRRVGACSWSSRATPGSASPACSRRPGSWPGRPERGRSPRTEASSRATSPSASFGASSRRRSRPRNPPSATACSPAPPACRARCWRAWKVARSCSRASTASSGSFRTSPNRRP